MRHVILVQSRVKDDSSDHMEVFLPLSRMLPAFVALRLTCAVFLHGLLTADSTLCASWHTAVHLDECVCFAPAVSWIRVTCLCSHTFLLSAPTLQVTGTPLCIQNMVLFGTRESVLTLCPVCPSTATPLSIRPLAFKIWFSLGPLQGLTDVSQVQLMLSVPYHWVFGNLSLWASCNLTPVHRNPGDITKCRKTLTSDMPITTFFFLPSVLHQATDFKALGCLFLCPVGSGGGGRGVGVVMISGDVAIKARSVAAMLKSKQKQWQKA